MSESGTNPGTPSLGTAGLADLKQLGRYRILGELGRGAMGIVFEAVDPKIGRKVALKVLTSVPGVTESELDEFRSRFFREARTAGMLSHPNIVVIHDVDHDEALGISYMAMECLKGQTLYDILRSGVRFTREQAIDLCVQVAEGLDHAHRQGIIHRDIKPANLMLLEDGTVKITDFGIAKISTSNLTKTGQFLGTPNYMSPEQVIGHVIDGRSDLFGLGIILYELLTGEKPFMGSSLTTITYQIVNVDPIEPSKIQPGIPKVFDEVVGRLLKKAPDDRFQTGKQVAEVLRGLREGLGGGTARTTGSPGLAAAASNEATFRGSGKPPRSGGPAPETRTARGPSNRGLLIGIGTAFLLLTAVLVALSLPGGDEPKSVEQASAVSAGAATEEVVTAPTGAAGDEDPAATGEPSPRAEANPPAEAQPPPEETKPAVEPARRVRTASPPVGEPAPSRRPAPVERNAERTDPPRQAEPEPEPRIVPRQAEPLPVRPPVAPRENPVAPRLGTATLNLRFEHKLKDGRLVVQVDGAPVASYSFETERKKGGNLLESFEVQEGSRVVRVCLESSDMKEGTLCAHREHRFVMNTSATLRALHQKVPFSPDKFSFDIQ